MCKVSCLINTDSSNICNLYTQTIQGSHHFPLLFPSLKLYTNTISLTQLPLPLYPCSSLSSFSSTILFQWLTLSRYNSPGINGSATLELGIRRIPVDVIFGGQYLHMMKAGG